MFSELLADLIEERGSVVGCLVLTFGPFSNALVHMVQLFQHILAQLGLAVFGCQWVFTLYCGNREAIIHHVVNKDSIVNCFIAVIDSSQSSLTF